MNEATAISAPAPVHASYSVNERAIARARELIESRQYVARSEWGQVQPRAANEEAFLVSGIIACHYRAADAFVYGDFRRLHVDILLDVSNPGLVTRTSGVPRRRRFSGLWYSRARETEIPRSSDPRGRSASKLSRAACA